MPNKKKILLIEIIIFLIIWIGFNASLFEPIFPWWADYLLVLVVWLLWLVIIFADFSYVYEKYNNPLSNKPFFHAALLNLLLFLIVISPVFFIFLNAANITPVGFAVGVFAYLAIGVSGLIVNFLVLALTSFLYTKTKREKIQ